MMNPPRPKASLCYLEPAAFAKKQVRSWNSDVLECNFGVTLRCVVETEYFHWSYHRHARSVHRHENHGLLRVAVVAVRIRLAHDDHDLGAIATGTTDVPLVTVNQVVVAFSHYRGLYVRRVRRRYRWLRHCECRTNLTMK